MKYHFQYRNYEFERSKKLLIEENNIFTIIEFKILIDLKLNDSLIMRMR